MILPLKKLFECLVKLLKVVVDILANQVAKSYLECLNTSYVKINEKYLKKRKNKLTLNTKLSI